jgi:hypothetical protein
LKEAVTSVLLLREQDQLRSLLKKLGLSAQQPLGSAHKSHTYFLQSNPLISYESKEYAQNLSRLRNGAPLDSPIYQCWTTDLMFNQSDSAALRFSARSIRLFTRHRMIV